MMVTQDRIQALGLEIFERSNSASVSLFDKGYWSGKMMEWAMQNAAFKVEMFRFVDVLPALGRSEQVAEHIRQYFLRPKLEFPTVIRAGMGIATASGLTAKIAAASIKKNVESMASTFITGENSQAARKVLEKLWNSGFCFTVDILGEAVVSENEATDYQRRYLELVEGLSRDAAKWKPQAQLESSPLGPVPRANVSVKCSSLYSQLDVLAFRQSADAVKARLRPILQAAMRNGVFINLDMEQNDYRELFLTVAEEIFSEPEFAQYPHFGVVIQAYLKCALNDLERVIACSSKRGTPLTVRLVKGAYWDYEVIQAMQRGWPIPVFVDKAETDKNYERCVEVLLRSYPRIVSAFGSHNVRSLSYAMTLAEELKLPKNAFEVQMLYGMADSFKKAIAGMGYRIREYAPVGEMLPGMAYLVRRLLENTSNEGFLRKTFVSKENAQSLLQDPALRVVAKNGAAHDFNHDENKGVHTVASTNKIFRNEPLRDFSLAENRTWIEGTVTKVRKSFPITVPVIVNGAQMDGLQFGESFNPSKSTELVSRYALATPDIADLAVRAAMGATKTWGQAPVEARIEIIRRVGTKLQAQKNELTALMVLEVGKNYKEADADVAEAIDFCFYYADLMAELAKPRDMGSSPGESNRYLYRPRGTAVVIAPWNFPLAILTGMAVGPLVAGNPVILKPAEQSPAIALSLYKILRDAGVPADAVHLVPGKGEVVGAHLVKSPHIHIVTFTGSRAVGLNILETANKVLPGQKHVKKVVAEMGGKNGLLVDDDADLDEAVLGSLHSVFGFQGQKCSALSRILIHEACYDRFKARFIEALSSLKIGPAEDLAAKVGPVIDAESQERLLGVIERNKKHVLAQVPVPAELVGKGYYVPATVFESRDFQSELGQQEFFGPLVTLFKIENLEEGIARMNDVDYALTGGIYSRSPQNIDKAREEIEVGNLYINRGITGALVFRQPFGGYKLSGVGAKAGGPDYLLQFLEPRTVTENTMRRGFAPEI